MNWLEVALLIFGAGAFAGSFLIKGKVEKEDDGQQVDAELVRSFIEKEMEDAKERVSEVVDETLEYAVEKTERASERISKEKIMAISEYSDTELTDINTYTQEVTFLYDMLNDKHNNLKETVKHVDKTAKEAEEAANAAAIALAAKAKEDAEAKEREKLDSVNRNKTAEHAWDKEAQEKEYARRQMARLILPMQQDMPMHRQVDMRTMDFFADFRTENRPDYRPADMRALAVNQEPDMEAGAPAELSPLVVKSVEIVPADIVTSSDMKPIPENTSMEPVSAAELQTLGSRPEDMTVVDVKPADIRPVEVYSFAEQAPHIERPVKKEVQPAVFEDTANIRRQQETFVGQSPASDLRENNNDRILRLHKEGFSNVDIAKELGLGVGEVKLVINLFKGAV